MTSAPTQKLQRIDHPEGAPSRLLVIAGIDERRQQLVDGFKAAGWQVREARDLREAMNVAMAQQPSAIVSELVLPDTRGFQFARTLRSAVEHDVRIVGLTALPEELSEEAQRAGFDRVFADTTPIEVIVRALAQR